jgi:hypothetical protein
LAHPIFLLYPQYRPEIRSPEDALWSEDDSEHTLEDVGRAFAFTRERIRQIEAKALRKVRPPSSSGKLRLFLDNVHERRGRDAHAGRARKDGSASADDLSSFTAMRYTVASLRCVPQSMQGVHRVIQSLFLFDVVSGDVKQLPCP